MQRAGFCEQFRGTMRSHCLLIAALASFVSACDGLPPSEEEHEELATTTDALVTTSMGYLYPRDVGGYYFQHLTGGAICEDGRYQTSCLADRLDFSLMPHLTTAATNELRARIAASTADLAMASALVRGQWRIVTVRDSRTGQSYRRIDFQVLEAYQANATGLHSAKIYKLSGTGAQKAQLVSTSHYLPFWATVTFPCPVIANSNGVVSDAYVSGTVTDPSITPRPLNADRYFGRL